MSEDTPSKEPKKKEDPKEDQKTRAPTARVAALTLRFLTALGVGCWVAGYAVWVFGPKDGERAQRIWAPMAWLIRNPPDATLATLLGLLILMALFFEPMHDFLMDLEEVLGAKRGPRVPARAPDKPRGTNPSKPDRFEADPADSPSD